ncbi:MAG: ACP S-malonyltransferase [Bdellovibrionales bacterium]
MLAALFPGQGSQSPGMGKFLWDQFKTAKECFEEASDAISLNFKKLCFDGSESDLALTENTQPAIVLVSTATFRVLHSEFGLTPKMAAGHSVGEYSAVVAAEAMPFPAAIRAVRTRGRAMQEAVPIGQGGMTAVMGLDGGQIKTVCEWAMKKTGDGPIEPANLNAPGQIVISGKKTLLDWLASNYSSDVVPGASRVKFIPLKVSAPFHCSMMKPAETVMKAELADIHMNDARFPVVQNFTATPVHQASALRENLVSQICAPVRWIESIHAMKNLGLTKAVESGSGRVLAGLVKKIDAEISVMNINSLEELKSFEDFAKGV